MLSRIDWADAMQKGSIDDCAEHFDTIFFEAASNCMPAITVQFALKTAWITADIRWAIKQRYRCLKKQNVVIKTKTGKRTYRT